VNALQLGRVPLLGGGAGRPPVTARERMESTRSVADEIKKAQELKKRSHRPSSARPSSRVPWRGAERLHSSDKGSSPKPVQEEIERKAETEEDIVVVDDRDSLDDPGEGDDHVSIVSEPDSEGEGEMRVLKYGSSFLRTHLAHRPTDTTRQRLVRVERAVLRDPNPDVVDGIINEALIKRKAKEEATERARKAVEFCGLLKEQEAERRSLKEREVEEEKVYGEMLSE
jgi:hypothetical protein